MIFAPNNFGEDFFGASVGDGRLKIVYATEGGGKEEAERDDAVRGADIFIGNGATDGGFVDANLACDFGHGEGSEGGGSLRKVVSLAVSDNFEKFLEGFLTSFEGLHEKACGSNSFFEIRAGLFIGGGVAEQVFVDVVDAESGENIPFKKGDPLIAVANKGCFGADDKVETVGGEGGAWARRKVGDDFGGGSDGLDWGLGSVGDLREFTFSQEVEVVADDTAFKGVVATTGVELEKERFWEGASGHSWGVKRLDEGEGLGGDGGRDLGGDSDFGEVGMKEAVIVEVPDDFGGSGAKVWFGEGEGELGGEVIGEGFG